MPEVREQVKKTQSETTTKKAPGLAFRRLFTKPGVKNSAPLS